MSRLAEGDDDDAPSWPMQAADHGPVELPPEAAGALLLATEKKKVSISNSVAMYQFGVALCTAPVH